MSEEEKVKALTNAMPHDILVNTNWTLFKDSKAKDIEIERLNKELELQKLELEETKKEVINQDKYIDKLKIEYDKELEFERQIKKEAIEYCRNDNNFQIITVEPYAHSMVKGIQRKLLAILDKAGSDIE